MKRIDYQATLDSTSSAARDTIDVLEIEIEKGNITDYSVEYREAEDKLLLHIWHDFPDGDDPDAHYDRMNTALSNLPVSVPHSAERSPIRKSK